MNPVIHFELPAVDSSRMQEFYSRCFGWHANPLGPEMGEYVLVSTTESDENGPKRPGAINGGFFQRTGNLPLQHPSVVIRVDDIEQHIAMVMEAGGAPLGEPTEIPGVGHYVNFVDTEGNRVGMIQFSEES